MGDLLKGPFKVVEHGKYFWVADTCNNAGSFRICAMVDIGNPKEYAQAICDMMNDGLAHRNRIIDDQELELLGNSE